LAETQNEGKDAGVLSYRTLLHRIDLTKENVLLASALPPASMELAYKDIVSVEHRRLVDYGSLKGVAAGVIITYVFLGVQFVKDIVAAFILEIGLATGTTKSITVDPGIRASADQVCMWIAVFGIIVAGYYMIKYIFSLTHRLVIYRPGKKPISFPFPSGKKGAQVLEQLQSRVKEAGAISKKEAEEILGAQVRRMLDDRLKMQKQLVDSVKAQVKAAKTPAEKALVKIMLKEGIDKLEQQDEVIDHELKKTGLKKEDIFKKYRIKEPDKKFIDSVLQGAEVEELPEDLK